MPLLERACWYGLYESESTSYSRLLVKVRTFVVRLLAASRPTLSVFVMLQRVHQNVYQEYQNRRIQELP